MATTPRITLSGAITAQCPSPGTRPTGEWLHLRTSLLSSLFLPELHLVWARLCRMFEITRRESTCWLSSVKGVTSILWLLKWGKSGPSKAGSGSWVVLYEAHTTLGTSFRWSCLTAVEGDAEAIFLKAWLRRKDYRCSENNSLTFPINWNICFGG